MYAVLRICRFLVFFVCFRLVFFCFRLYGNQENLYGSHFLTTLADT